jgi:hypothetical protein
MGHGGSPVLWIVLLVPAVFIGIPAVTIAVAVLLRARRSRAELPAGGASAAARDSQPDISAVRAQADRVTRFGLTGLGGGALLGLALVLDGQPAAALTCGTGYLVGLLVGEYAAQPPARGQQRAAMLRARRPADYTPRWAAVAIGASVIVMIAASIVFSVVPTISYGRWRPDPGQTFSLPGSTTSWPGLRGMLAGLAFSALVLLLGRVGLGRIADRPQLAEAGLQSLDELLRRQAGRAITGAVLSLQLMLLAAYLLAGSTGLGVPTAAVSTAAYAGNRVMVFAGLACAAGSIVSWLVLSGWLRRRRPDTGPPPEPALRAPG